MTTIEMFHDDVINWIETKWDGTKYHVCCCDPPYHLGKGSGFMGKEWDSGDLVFRSDTWRSISRVLHPNAIVMAFMSSLTYPYLVNAMESAGLIVREPMLWLYSNGLPKGSSVQKVSLLTNNKDKDTSMWHDYRYGGQALKPCFEMIAVAHTPYEGSQISNILEWGTGAWNISGGRIKGGSSYTRGATHKSRNTYEITRDDDNRRFYNGDRYPSTIMISHDPRCGVECVEGCPKREIGKKTNDFYCDESGWEFELGEQPTFIHHPKANPWERSEGLASDINGSDENNHPTLKPIGLMSYLATISAPPKEYNPRAFIPFGGVASEGIGFLLSRCWEHITMVELEEEHVRIARKRISHAQTYPSKWAKYDRTGTLKMLALEKQTRMF